jgi:peptide/nickel transport system substrate-binding protein
VNARPLLALALVGALAPFACARREVAGHHGHNAWTIPGVLRLGEDEEPDNLNLMYSHTAASDTIAGMLYSFVLRYDANGNPIPDLATAVPTLRNGGISSDGRTITVHLRRNARWADGAPITAADWLLTYRIVRDPNTSVKSTFGWDDIASAQAPDAYTLVLHLKKPNVAVLGILGYGGAGYPPLPDHLLHGVRDLHQSAYDERPLSSGPYVLTQWTHGGSLVFAPNPHYFRGKPQLREVVWTVIPDLNSLADAFITHDVDVYPTVQADVLQRVRDTAGTIVSSRLVANWRHLGINCSRPQLADVRVRRAIAEAVDWARIERSVYHGIDRLAVSDIFPQSWAAPSLTPYRYDPAAARALLAAAGWHMGADGVLHKAALAMHLSVVATSGHPQNAQSQLLIQSMLRDVGIDVAVRNYAGSYLFAQNGPLYTGRYDLEWSIDTNGPDPENSGDWNGAFIPPHGANTSWLNDPVVNATSLAAASTFDQQKRKALYQREASRIREVVPAVFFSWETDETAMNSDLKHYVPGAFLGDAWNAWQWTI